MSVRGALQMSDAELKELAQSITLDDGTHPRTAAQVRELFMDELAMGHEVVPMTDCDNFDYKKGCMGHPSDKTKKGTKENGKDL
jgi:hypothetical protein